MNYLAHLFLSGENEAMIIGNFIGDDIRNSMVDKLDDNVQKGVLLHRAIDRFTDDHRSVRHATKLMRNRQYKYAPVVIDILFDYFLCRNWCVYSEKSFDDFCNDMYEVFSRNMEKIPSQTLKARTQRMIDARFLRQYATLEGIESTMERVAKRAKFNNNFESAVEDMLEIEEELNLHFNTFFPDMIEYSKKYRDKLILQ